MAGNFNKVMLMGNLTRDPELRHLPSGMAVAAMGLAVSRRYKDKDGQTQEETTFVDCDAWGRTGEMISQYFQKGRPILIEGRLRLDEWQDKTTGDKRSKLKVVVENFYFVDSRESGGGGGGPPGGARRPAGAPASRGADTGGSNYEPMGEDDIPF